MAFISYPDGFVALFNHVVAFPCHMSSLYHPDKPFGNLKELQLECGISFTTALMPIATVFFIPLQAT